MDRPRQVRIVEVGPRDGLQNESAIVSTDDKARFIGMLADAGLVDIEVSSFVSPKRVPQLADAAEVFARLIPPSPQPRPRSWGNRTGIGEPAIRYSALVPNAKGLERAVEAGVRNVAFFTAASETFTRNNIGMSIEESLDGFRAMMPIARERGMWVRTYVSTAFVCPFEGKIAPSQVAPVVQALLDIGVDEISIGDTIGHAVPSDVDALLSALRDILPLEKTALHFHDTRGNALANVERGLAFGVAVYDSSAGGTGGCPFAPGAAGNLATEALVTMLDGMGIVTGVDAAKITAAGQFIAGKLGH
jgi:hydroxymethylglutaryl-CoA lyase